MSLSRYEQQLLNTQFDPEMEKAAAEQVGALKNAYNYGFSKLAAEVADAQDEKDKEEDKADEKKKERLDEESEKAAAEMGAFIERGLFEGLCKLGTDRYNDPLHYIEPFILEKIATGAAQAEAGMIKNLLNKLKGGAGKAWGKTKGYHQGAVENILHPAGSTNWEKAKSVGKGVAKFSPHAAAAGLGGYGAYKALSGSPQQMPLNPDQYYGY